MSEKQMSLIKTLLALGGLSILMIFIFFMVYMSTIDSAVENEVDTALATEPVGKTNIKGEEVIAVTKNDTSNNSTPDEVAAQPLDGESVYKTLCVNCHGVEALAVMIPQKGDVAAWENRLKQDIEIIYKNAIDGFTGELGLMPAKGGNPNLKDEEVKAAVDYIINNSK